MVNLMPLTTPTAPATEHLQLQGMEVPAVHLKRVALYGRINGETLYQPTLIDLAHAVAILSEAGVPDSAEIAITQWKAPANRVYIEAEWPVAESVPAALGDAAGG